MKKSINDVLEELKFTEKEKVIFRKCISIVKEEQKTGLIDGESAIQNAVKEILEDEI